MMPFILSKVFRIFDFSENTKGNGQTASEAQRKPSIYNPADFRSNLGSSKLPQTLSIPQYLRERT